MNNSTKISSNPEVSAKTLDIEANVSKERRDDCTPDKNSKSTRKSRKRRRSSTDEEFDTSIDVKLKQSAIRNNLTPQNVKNILQKVVRNDHVLAIVKLKEEELERQEQIMKELKAANEIEKEVTTDGFENAIPKLTRAKAKALNKYPLPVAPIKHSEPDSEVVALISEELHSDDDDEEYQPGEDDIEMDSDFDSQPATPSSQADASEETQTAVYSQDGLFKIPRLRNDSTTSQCEQEYIIAQRTRSKISLAETPIEAIESTFKAPDAPLDMYHEEHDMDPNWIQFLNSYSMPLNTSEIEKDEDADPDYCPEIVDNHPDDREEFQHVNVSKKEATDLLNDLYSLVDMNLLDLNEFDILTLDTGTSKHPPAETDNLNDSLVTPIKQDEEPLNTPEPNKTQTQETIGSPLSCNPEISYFDPSAISTPAKPNYDNNSFSSLNQTQQQQSFDSFNSTLLSVNEPIPPCAYSINPMQDKSSVFVPVMTFTTNSNASPHQLALPYNSILITIPPEATMTTPAMPPTMISSVQSNNSNSNLLLSQPNETGPKRPGCRAKRSRFKSAVYRELENLDPNAKAPMYFSSDKGFTAEQRSILETQLRIHVQLSTQSFLQTYGHPEFYPEAHRFKRFLAELVEIVGKGYISVYNLKPAMDLIARWESELSENTIENSEFFAHIQEEINKLRKNVGYTMLFHERFLRVICESKIFMYPDLLPAMPFRLKTTKPSEYFPAEDYLLAFLLEHFFEELRRKIVSYRFAKPKEVTLTSVSQHIAAHLNYLRHARSIYSYCRLRRDNELMNPIKFYFKHRRAPPIRHRYEVFNPYLVVEPAKQPLNALSTQWARYVEKLIGLKQDELLQKSIVQPSVLSPLDYKKDVKSTAICNKNEFTVKSVHSNTNANNNSSIQVKILYEPSGINQLETIYCYEKSDINDKHDSLIKGQTLLTSYFRPIQKSITNDLNDDNLEISIQVNEPIDTTADEVLSGDSKFRRWQSKRICKKYKRLNIRKFFIRKQTNLFFTKLVLKTRKKFSPHWHRFRRNSNVSFVYRCIILYHLFVTELINREKHTIKILSAKMTTEALITNRRIQKFSNENVSNARDLSEEHQVTAQPNDVGAKRLPKNQRTSESTMRLLLLSENTQESSDKDFLFVQRFMDRVEDTFIYENKHHKFTEFLSILRSFSENQQQQTGADLYLSLEKLLMPDNPELMDLFLSFLLPRDAVEINKTMDYFLKVNSTKFLNKLNIFFQKQPAQIRKVLACLKELSEEPDVTIERIKMKILPLLKGNQLLIDWFLQCIAPDKCESSKDEYETLVLRKEIDDDQIEYIPQSEIIADPNENPCHIRYMNGRLFYGNRFPLPAKLSFSAVPSSAAPFDSLDHEKQLVCGSGDKRQTHYHCVHNIKEFADSKMRDRHHSELEQAANGGTSDDIDNSDDEQHYSMAVDKIEEKSRVEISDESSTNTSATSNHILCDNTLLKAHSIRLNPSLRTPFISSAEILNKLKPQDQSSTGDANSIKELKLSPKKQASNKNSTSLLTKLSHVRKTNSPNAKKVTPSRSKSPNNRKTTSPLLQNIESAFTSQTAQQESNAYSTDEATKRIAAANNKNKSQKSHMLSKPIKKQKRVHEYYDSGDEEETSEELVKKDESKNQNDSHKNEIQWTREEDRLLLEQIKAGIDSNTEFISESFAGRFPSKTQDQIRDRISFLIDFLTKLRNKHT